MAGPRASLEIHGPRAGRVEDAIGTLHAIETAYNVLYYTNLQLNWTYEIVQHKVPYSYNLIWLSNVHWSLLNPGDIRQVILPEDVLEIGVVKFESPGFWEFLGALNPLDQIRQFISDRHERNKDIKYRNAAEKKKLELENERLATKVFSDRVEVLKKAGYPEEQIRSMILPSAIALNSVANAQDEGLIDTAELKRIEDRSGEA